MSYILEALKKSEQQRHQENNVPNIQAIHTPFIATSHTMAWPWVLSGILLINAAILAVVWLQPWSDASQSGSSNVTGTNTNNGVSPGTSTKTRTLNPNTASSKPNRENPVEQYSAQSPSTLTSAPYATSSENPAFPDTTTISNISNPTNVADSSNADTNTNTVTPISDDTDRWLVITPKKALQGFTPSSRGDDADNSIQNFGDSDINSGIDTNSTDPQLGEVLDDVINENIIGGLDGDIDSALEAAVVISPQISDRNNSATNAQASALISTIAFNQLPTAVQQSLPELQFSGHIYSSAPGFRRVLINGTKYREGAILFNRIVLNEITPNGVIMSTDGYTFQINVVDLL